MQKEEHTQHLKESAWPLGYNLRYMAFETGIKFTNYYECYIMMAAKIKNSLSGCMNNGTKFVLSLLPALQLEKILILEIGYLNMRSAFNFLASSFKLIFTLIAQVSITVRYNFELNFVFFFRGRWQTPLECFKNTFK